MERIRYEVKVEDTHKTCVNALMGKSIFEYKVRVSDIRILQTAFIMLAGIIADLPDHIGILILDETKISGSRLKYEWKNLSKIIQPFILSRIRMVVISDGLVIEKYGNISKEEFEVLSEIQEKLSQRYNNKHHRKPDAFLEILRILLIHWFRGSGPLQLNQLSQLSGFSYPTVAMSLEKMKSQLKRHSDRSIELKSFPRDHWFKLLAASDDIRVSQGYWARRPKNIEDLIQRVIENANKDVACGGIIGAKHYLPNIDLIGIPCLDLTVHNWTVGKIDKFIRNLDPGLKKVESGEIPQVIIHKLFRHESLFVFTKGSNLLIADEVECLLDLHEARLESQALELLENLKRQANR